ncbi:HEPN domain-containing protein [Vibrio sp. PP-XX7]
MNFKNSLRLQLKKSYIKKAAFELHQATERFFACTLLTLTNYLPKTHNIEKLKKFCADQDLAFADIFPMDDKFHRRSFRRLQRAYIDARYSMHYEITEEELAYLGSEVEKLEGLVEKQCVWHGFISEEPYAAVPVVTTKWLVSE